MLEHELKVRNRTVLLDQESGFFAFFFMSSWTQEKFAHSFPSYVSMKLSEINLINFNLELIKAQRNWKEVK